MSLPAVSVHLLALGPFLIVSIPSFSLFNSKVVSPGLNPSTCSWSGTLKGCLVEDGREGMIGKTAACVFVRVSACKLDGNLCPCVCLCECVFTQRWDSHTSQTRGAYFG